MVETRTARMRLVHWSEGTDSPQRVDFNETFLSIESLAAIDQQGTRQSRPTPNKTGMYYFATDEGILYRSDGIAWAVVGSSTLSHLVKSARSDSVAFTVQAIASQSADLMRVLAVTGSTLARIRSNGDLLLGPLRVSQAARTAASSDTAPSDSAVTVDNSSTGMWGVTAKSLNGDSTGHYRAVRGTSTVFSVDADGTVNSPAVKLGSAPSSDSHAVRVTDLNEAVNGARYAFDGPNLTGILPTSRGGTGRSTAPRINSGTGLTGGGDLTADRTLQVIFEGTGSSTSAARSDHGHTLTDANILGVLPVTQGGTGATTAEAAREALDVPDVAHGHALTASNITGTLPVNKGGTGRSTITEGTYLRGNGTTEVTMRQPAEVLADIDGLPRSLEILAAGRKLNTLTTTGTYRPFTSDDATNANNYPFDVGNSSVVAIEVIGYSATYVAQELTLFYNNRKWRRTQRNGTWYEWVEYGAVETTANLKLYTARNYPGHGYVPQIVRDGKRRTLRGRIGRTAGDGIFVPLSGGSGNQESNAYKLLTLDPIDIPSSTMSFTTSVTGFSNIGVARVEVYGVGSNSWARGDVITGVSQNTSWIGLDGCFWYVD